MVTAFTRLLQKHHNKEGNKDPIFTYEGEYAKGDLVALSYLIEKRIRSGYTIDKENNIKPVDCTCKLRVWFIDFEAYSNKMCGHGAKKNEPIMMVTIWDSYEDKLYTLYVNNPKWTNTQRRLIKLNFKSQYKKHTIKSFISEAKFLDYIIELSKKLNPDLISAWNLDRYDIVQMKYRMDVNKDKCFYSFKHLSPLYSVNPYRVPYRVKGRILFDLMRAFKKYTQAELRSYSLESVAKNENIEIEKIPFKGTTANTWDKYPEVIFKRNVNDVLIMMELDKKYELVDMFNDLRCEFGALFHEVFMNYRIVDTELLRFVSDNIALSTAKGKRPEGKFKGATVVEPIIGAHSNIAQFDFSREYPHIMIMFNISPETYRESDYEGECYTIEHEGETYRFIKKYIGLLPKLIKFFFNKRDEYDKKQLRAIKEGNEDKAKMWFRRSFIMKGITNSIYGVMDYPQFRLYKRECSAATAAVGRLSIEEINKIVSNLGYKLIYGDSVLGDTPITIRKDNIVSVIPIIELFKTYTKLKHKVNNIEVWTENGWSRIKYVYRHKTKKDVYGILTKKGYVECTEDHSLVIDNKEVKPSNLNIGDKIDYIPFKGLENNKVDNDISWLIGAFLGFGTCGIYKTKWGIKNSFHIDKTDINFLKRCQCILKCKLGFDTKILDIRKSSGTYRLVPYNGIKTITHLFRNWCYTKSGEKSIPNFILNSNAKVEFMEGYTNSKDKVNFLTQKTSANKVLLHGLSLLLNDYGIDYYLSIRPDKPKVIRLRTASNSRRKDNVITKIRKFAIDDYVYDIETDNHHFVGGIGGILLHNTDSIFVKLKSKDKEELVKEAKLLQDKLNKGLTKFFIEKFKVKSAPADLSLDKIYNRYLLLAKKNYAGKVIWSSKKGLEGDYNTEGDYDLKGFEPIRSDSSNLEKNMIEKLTKLWLNEESIDTINEHIDSSYKQLKDKEVDILDLAYPQQIKHRFKDYGYNQQKRKRVTIPSHIRSAVYSNSYLNTDFEKGDKPRRLPIIKEKKKRHVEGQSTIFAKDEIYPTLYKFERVKGDIRKWTLNGISIAENMDVPTWFINRIDYNKIYSRLEGKVNKIMHLIREFK